MELTKSWSDWPYESGNSSWISPEWFAFLGGYRVYQIRALKCIVRKPKKIHGSSMNSQTNPSAVGCVDVEHLSKYRKTQVN